MGETIERRAEIDEFLRRLSGEQTKFLCAMAEARQLLNGDSGQVKMVAALQSRLTQQFLDAQRLIIRHRADADARVAWIGADADAEASRIVAEAHGRAEAIRSGAERLAPPDSGVGPVDGPVPAARPATPPSAPSVIELPPPTRTTPMAAPGVDSTAVGRVAAPPTAAPVGASDIPGSRAEVHRRIVELSTSVVRTSDEAHSMASVIDEAFETVEPDGAVAARRLRELLEDWWLSEKQEGGASVDDASARAAMRVHLARIEADELVAVAAREGRIAAPAPTVATGSSVGLPPPLVEALDTADHLGLEQVLSSLLDSLDDPGASTAPSLPEASAAIRSLAGPDGDARAGTDTGRNAWELERWNGQIRPATAEPVIADLPVPVLPAARPDHLTAPGPAPQEAFDRFWTARQGARPTKRDWVFVQVLFPAVSAIAVLALVLAWIG